ncbi:MAG: cell envelope integrity protein TolA, partial [Casimicrobiaceae bacterium]
SVTWQNRPPAPVTAELYAPPATTLAPLPTAKLPALPPPRPLPPPPPLATLPATAPPPPTPSRANIEFEAKQAAARREEAKKEADARKLAEQKAQQEAKRQADRQARALAAMQAQAQHELQAREDAERDARLRTQAETESRLREQAEQEAQARAQQAATATARSRAEADWIDRIRSRIRSNINLPPEIAGNPEAVFDVVQLPTGEVLRVQMQQSSGIPAYDDAVQRAILKSSPLPPPPSPDLFQRELVLRFRPHER